MRFTKTAREDLLEIWLYVAARNSASTADRIYDRIAKSCRLLEDQPRLGRARPEIHAEARAMVIERWLALYRIVGEDLQIVRRVDGARDLNALNWPPDSPAAASD